MNSEIEETLFNKENSDDQSKIEHSPNFDSFSQEKPAFSEVLLGDEDKIPEPKSQINSLKRQVHFNIPSSRARRNIDKHVVRTVSKNYPRLKSNIIRDFEEKKIELSQLQDCESIIFQLREKEKHKEIGNKSCKKDYASVIENLLGREDTRIIVRRCLLYSLEKMNSNYTRIKPKNLELYKKSDRDYINYIEKKDF